MFRGTTWRRGCRNRVEYLALTLESLTLSRCTGRPARGNNSFYLLKHHSVSMAAQPQLIAISLIDFVAAFLLVWSFPGTFMLVLALVLMSKGIWSIISSVRNGFYFDFLGWVDFAAAVVLLAINSGMAISFAWIVGIIIAVKAVYTLLTSL